MEYRRLGSAGVQVSSLCLGAMMFGKWGNADAGDCTRIVHAALDAGINFIDTSNNYSDGESERIVGAAIAGRRDSVVLATKVWGAMGPGPNDRGLSRKAIFTQCEASLRRLGTDSIDLYQIHRPDPTVPWDETLGALDDLVRQGKVRYLGCSTNHYTGTGVWEKSLPAWEIVETLWRCDRRGFQPFVSLQPPYSILRRVMETEHFPMTRRYGIANIVWSPLEGGWLTGKYRKGRPNPADTPRATQWVGDLTNPKFARRLDIVERLVDLAARRETPLAEFATAWVLRNPDVTCAIIGPRTQAQLTSSLRALSVKITPEEDAAIDAWVPPGTSAL